MSALQEKIKKTGYQDIDELLEKAHHAVEQTNLLMLEMDKIRNNNSTTQTRSPFGNLILKTLNSGKAGKIIYKNSKKA